MTDHHELLARWPAVIRRVEPLPGGVHALRRRLREHRAPRKRWFAAVAATCVVAVTALWLLVPRGVAVEQRSTALFAGGQPHPEAVQLGLATAARAHEQTNDPRVADDVVVFRWVTSADVQAPRVAPPSLDPRDRENQLRPGVRF